MDFLLSFTLWHYWDSIRRTASALAWITQLGPKRIDKWRQDSELLSFYMSGHNLASQMFFQDMTKLCNSITNFKRHLLSTHHGTCTPPKVLWLGFSNCDHNSIWSHKKSSKEVINVKTKKNPKLLLSKTAI